VPDLAITPIAPAPNPASQIVGKMNFQINVMEVERVFI
jgi:hypothetical protein